VHSFVALQHARRSASSALEGAKEFQVQCDTTQPYVMGRALPTHPCDRHAGIAPLILILGSELGEKTTVL
jgi:hypothetical protein